MNQINKDKRFARMGFRKASSNSGFTLVEVMVAAVLLLLILSAGFGALSRGMRLIELSRDETRASQILQSEIEWLRTYHWTALNALPAESVYSPVDLFTSAYADRYEITRAITTRSSTQRRVTMQVAWTDNRGMDHVREYMTLISKDGLYDYYYRTF